ncbi:MAG: O-antigen ligase family protein [Elusimicrobiota bacterium]
MEKLIRYKKEHVGILIFSAFFISGFFFEGYKKSVYFIPLFVFLAVFFYLKNIRVGLTSGFGFIFLMLFSLFFGDFKSESFFSISVWILCVFSYYFVSNMKEEEKKYFFKSFNDILIYASTFISILVLINFIKGGRFYVIGNNPNYAAILISISIFACFLRFLDNKKIIFLFYTAVCLGAITVLNSRSGYLSLVISFFILYSHKKGLKKALFALLFLLIIFILSPWEIISYFLKMDDPKAYYRPYIWLSSLKAFVSSPIWGFGGGSFEYVFEKFKFPYFDGFCYYNHSSVHAHNEFLNIAVENGITVLLAYLLILKKWFLSKEKNEIYFSIMIITVFSLFDIVLKLPFIRIIYFLFLGYYESNFKYEVGFRKIILLVVLFFVAFAYAIKDKNFKKYEEGYLELSQNPNDFRKSAVSEYLFYHYPLNPIFAFETAKFYESVKDYDKALNYAEKALKIEPNFNRALLMTAYLKFIKGEAKDFKNYIDKIKIVENGERNFYFSYISSLNLNLYYRLLKEVK